MIVCALKTCRITRITNLQIRAVSSASVIDTPTKIPDPSRGNSLKKVKTTTLYGYEKCKPQPFRVARVKLTKNKKSQTFLVINFDTASVQTQTV